MLILLTTTIIAGTFTAFSPTYISFLFGIFACGFSSIGAGTVLYCWMMEILSGKAQFKNWSYVYQNLWKGILGAKCFNTIFQR